LKGLLNPGDRSHQKLTNLDALRSRHIREVTDLAQNMRCGEQRPRESIQNAVEQVVVRRAVCLRSFECGDSLTVDGSDQVEYEKVRVYENALSAMLGE
jgi:hypothetical protein